jgi:hypothetical protein
MRRARQGAGHCAAAEQLSGEGATVRYIRMTFLPDDETSTKRKSRLTGVVASGLQASDTCRKTEAPHDGLVSRAARDPVPDPSGGGWRRPGGPRRSRARRLLADVDRHTEPELTPCWTSGRRLRYA